MGYGGAGTFTDTGRTCKLDTEKPRAKESTVFLLWTNTDNHCTPVSFLAAEIWSFPENKSRWHDKKRMSMDTLSQVKDNKVIFKETFITRFLCCLIYSLLYHGKVLKMFQLEMWPDGMTPLPALISVTTDLLPLCCKSIILLFYTKRDSEGKQKWCHFIWFCHHTCKCILEI